MLFNCVSTVDDVVSQIHHFPHPYRYCQFYMTDFVNRFSPEGWQDVFGKRSALHPWGGV